MEEEEVYDNLNPNLTQNTKKTKQTYCEKIRSFLKSEKFHTIVVVLVVFDCLCVTLELTLEHIEKYVLGDQKRDHVNNDLHFYFHLFENILKYTTITILALFVLEVVTKLVFIPKVFIESKWEILDALVVVISFAINIYLLKNKQLVMSIGALLTLLRLWRITEIVNGKLIKRNNLSYFQFKLFFIIAVIVTIQTKNKREKEQLEEIIRNLKHENEYLRNELLKLHS